MHCDEARAALSAVLDREASDEVAAAAAAHRADCDRCATFDSSISAIRRTLRVEPVGAAPDVAPAVVTQLDRSRPHRSVPWLRVAAAFVAGLLVGSVVIGVSANGPGDIAAADLPARVVAAQRDVHSLRASFTLVEHGWHHEVQERTFSGSLTYAAPESVALELRDRTDYPSALWVPNDMALVVDEASAWSKGVRACPAEAQPTCTPVAPLVLATTGREPFAESQPVPLDMVTPVESFGLAGTAEILPSRRVAGRTTIGVAGTAAQFAPLLDALGAAGNLRDLYPGDRAEVWLDRDSSVPVAVRVSATDGRLRERWATARGYVDEPGAAVLELTVRRLVVNGTVPDDAFPAAPAGAVGQDHGFVETTPARSDVPDPATVPAGFSAYRAGTIQGRDSGRVGVRTWTDGRAWLMVSSTTSWTGSRLFGHMGAVVRVVDLGAAGTAYASEDGTRVAIHGDGVDVVVVGSTPTSELVSVASALGIVGGPVPSGWVEASTASLAEARRDRPDLLVPSGLGGFASPAVRASADGITLSFAGPGARGFQLTEYDHVVFTPPLDPDTFGLTVRGRDGRYSPDRHEIEWVEGGRTISLRSTTLSVEELLAIADGLVDR